MKKKIGIIVILLALFQLGFIVSSANKTTDKSEVKYDSTKIIDVMTVKKNQHSEEIVSSGNIMPGKTVKVAFKVAGVIESINFNEGDLVNKGDLLASLDDNQYELNSQAAKSEYESLKLKVSSEIPSAINQAESQLKLAKQRFENVSKLYEEGGISKDKYDEVQTTLVTIENKYNEAINAKEVYEKKLTQAKTMTELANTKLVDTKIESPIGGVVIKKLNEVGETTGTGYPVIVIGEVDSVQAQIGLSDEYINKINVGDKATVFVYGAQKNIEGEITEIGALADDKTRTFPVKITLNNQEHSLKPGMIAKVNIPLKKRENILVPVDCVINMPYGPAVFVYEDSNVKEVAVETGDIVKDNIEILSGLNDNDQVVVNGQFMLKDNDKAELGGSK